VGAAHMIDVWIIAQYRITNLSEFSEEDATSIFKMIELCCGVC